MNKESTVPIMCIDPIDVKRDVNSIFKAAKLCELMRFSRKRFWEEESVEEEYCQRLRQNKPRNESVADHSWHLADMVLLISPHFEILDMKHCLSLAILHDKLEIWCDDSNPLGRDGTGRNSFAFNADEAKKRDTAINIAAKKYLCSLSAPSRIIQQELIEEILTDESIASHFVRALDKLQVFVFLIRRKKGIMVDDHIAFNLRYAKRFVDRVPFLLPYYEEFVERLFSTVAHARMTSVEKIRQQFATILANTEENRQIELPLEDK